MASQYALSFSLPDDFPGILKAFSQKILHAINMEKSCGFASSDIYGFAAKYFTQLAAKKASENSSVLTKEELDAMATQLFVAADTNESGSLDESELRAILTELAAALGFTKKKDIDYVVTSVMKVADVDSNGLISYEEFLPIATDIIQTIYSETMQTKTSERKELEELVVKIFNSYDVDRNGYLDANEFTAVFTALSNELGLTDDTERLATEVMSVVDSDEDDHVSLKEFMPLCVECLRVMLEEAENAEYSANNGAQDVGADDSYNAQAEDILRNSLSDEDLENTLLELFQSADLDSSGTLEKPEFSKCLLEANIGLSQAHVDAILKDVDENDDGVVDFIEFAPLAYGLLVKVIAEQLREEDQANAVTDYENGSMAKAQDIVQNLSQEELRSTLMTIFAAADANGSGALDREEFRGCLEQANLGLTDEIIEILMDKVDANADNLISYEEFAPLCYEILVEVVNQELQQQDFEQAAVDNENAQMLAEAEAYLVSGFNEAELRELLLGVFEEADADGSKMLDPSEFKEALELSELQLSPDEVEQVLQAVDADGDGQISYEEFIPVAFRILVEITRDEMVAAADAAASSRTGRAEAMLVQNLSREQLTDTLMELFRDADKDDSGKLDKEEFTASLRGSDVGFSDEEIDILAAEVDVDSDGAISFEEFAPLAYDLLVEHVARAMDTAEAEDAARMQVKEMLVHGMDRDELERTLREIFKQHDTDDSGFLTEDQFYDCLSTSELGLSEAEIEHFRTAIDTNDDGKIDFDEFAPLCYDMLVEVMTKQLVAGGGANAE